MTKPNFLVLSGLGINCDNETKYAFELAGARADKVHTNDLIASPEKLRDYQGLVIPGGFSYGDDTGSGKALANKLKNHLWQEVLEFASQDKLILGICNGFQVLANLGLVPALDGDYGKQEVALTHNDFPRYLDRWVDLEFSGTSPWTRNVGKIALPIAHGEGKFYAPAETLRKINERGLVAARYVHGVMCDQFQLNANPNGSLEDIAGITDESGRVLGLMPHPERAINLTQLPNWTLLKRICKDLGEEVPEKAEGLKIIQNGVDYFK